LNREHNASGKNERSTPPRNIMKLIHVLAAVGGLSLACSVGAADSKANWEEHCAKCHGADGKGQTKMGKKLGIRDYTDAKAQGEFTDDQALQALKAGVKGKDGKLRMQPAEELSEDDMKALVQFIRSLKV
jgi:cytochrome c553